MVFIVSSLSELLLGAEGGVPTGAREFLEAGGNDRGVLTL